MKTSVKILCALLAVLTLALCACQKNPTEVDVPDGMTLASGDIVDYYLFVPADWRLDLSGGMVSAFKSSADPTSVSVMTWETPYADDTPADVWEMYKGEFESVFSEFTVESSTSMLLDGVAAEKYVYTGKLAENTFRYTQVIAVRHSAAYLITITEITSSEADHTEEINAILDNFRWK